MNRVCRILTSLLLTGLLIMLPLATTVARADRAKPGDTVGTVDTGASNVALLNNTMLSKINGLRESQGVGDLSIDATLNSWRGENLSYVTYPEFGYTQAEQMAAADVMFDNLVASPTHYDNMVFGSFTKIGIRTSVLGTGDGTRLTTAYMFSS